MQLELHLVPFLRRIGIALDRQTALARYVDELRSFLILLNTKKHGHVVLNIFFQNIYQTVWISRFFEDFFSNFLHLGCKRHTVASRNWYFKNSLNYTSKLNNFWNNCESSCCKGLSNWGNEQWRTFVERWMQ